MAAEEWSTPEHALRYLARADVYPHRAAGEGVMLEHVPRIHFDEEKQAGWQHFAQAEWAAARDAFVAALEEETGDPEALDGLGRAMWWLGDRDAAIDSRREAFAAYQRRGDTRRAGGLAAYLAGECRIDGQDAAAAGWLARARRLLDGAGAVPERGWLAIEEAKRAADPEGGRAARPRRPRASPTARSILTSSAWPWLS